MKKSVITILMNNHWHCQLVYPTFDMMNQTSCPEINFLISVFIIIYVVKVSVLSI